MTVPTRLRRIWTGSIRRRLVLSVCGLVITVMAAFDYGLIVSQREFLERRGEERSLALAKTVAVNSGAWVEANDLAGLAKVIRSIRSYPDLRYVIVLAADGRILAHSDTGRIGQYPANGANRALVRGPPEARIALNTRSLLEAVSPIKSDSGTIVGWTRVGLGRSGLAAGLRDIRREGFYFAGAALVLGALMASLIGSGLARDLNKLVTVTRRVAAGDTSARSGMKGEDELGSLSRAFDTMAATLEKATAKLQDSEREWRQLLAHLPVAITIRATDGTYHYANDAARKILGIGPEELSAGRVMHPNWRLVREDGSFMPRDEIPSIRATEMRQPVRDRVLGIVRYGEHEPVWVHTDALPELDGNGMVRRVIESFSDISERKRAQELLHQRAEEFRALVENAPDPILRYDRECRRIYANPAVERLSGKPLSPLLGHASTNGGTFPTGNGDKLKDWVKGVLETGEPREGRVEFTGPDGIRHYFHNRFVPERDQSGEVVSVLSISTDITSVVKAERQLRTLVDNLPDMVSRFDTEGRHLYVSPIVERVFGLPRERFLGRTIHEIASPESRETTQALLDGIVKAAEDGNPNIMEVTWPLPHGARDYEIRYIPEKDETGKAISVLGVARDVTARRRVEEALRKTTEELDRFFSIVLDPLCIATTDGYFQRLNPAWEQVLGHSRTELMQVPFLRFVHPEDLAATSEAIEALGKQKEVVGLVNRYRCKDGTYKWIEWNITPAGERFYAAARDITERIRMTESLRQLSAAVEQTPVPVLITDVEGTIQYVNPAFSLASHYSAEEVIGKKPSILKDDAMSAADYDELWSTLKAGHSWRGIFHNLTKDGDRHWEEAVITPIRDEKGNITRFVGIQQDITDRKKEEERAEFLAHHDALTGLPNRILGKDRMERAIAHADRHDCEAALLFLDLDGFKQINDTLGHAIGDELLNRVAARLQLRMRRSDTIVRHGGDEFLIILSEIEDPEAINTVALATLDQLTTPFVISGHELSITASLGVAVYPADGQNWNDLFEKADVAMYSAKQAGRNTYRFFTEEMNAEADMSIRVRSKLQNALERGEFALHYQPQVDLKTGRVTGVEALLRWTNPELGQVAPSRFIPLAEDGGQIVPISSWVLKEACRQAKAWQDAGLPRMVMAVNLSMVQFRRGDLADSVREALESSGLDPGCLELELTESILIKDTAAVLNTVRQLKDIGVRLAIDDFGTGYSSLSYLKRLHADRVKIGHSFVHGMAAETDRDAVVHALVHVARSLGLPIVAEGVEDEAALAALQRHGCDEVQGFFYSRPMPPEEMAAFVNARCKAQAPAEGGEDAA